LAEVEKSRIDVLGPDDVLDHLFGDLLSGFIVA
jgi:hypothetical protein